MKANKDRIIVHEDRIRTGFECKQCDGLGYDIQFTCNACTGTKIDESGAPCRACKIGSLGLASSSGFRHCSQCNGKGATLIVPEQSERRPTSGRVVSCGPTCKDAKLGDHVLYGNYAGYAINIGLKTVIRIIHEDEILCWLFMAKDFSFNEASVINRG